MPTTTADQQLTLPAAGDTVNVPTAFSSYVGPSPSGVESRLIKRYASRADRAVRNPTPNGGEICWLDDLNQYELFQPSPVSLWLELRPLYAIKKTEVQCLYNQSGLTNDDQLFLDLQAGRYMVELNALYDTSAAADFRWSWSWTGTTGDIATQAWGLDVGSTTVQGAQRVDGTNVTPSSDNFSRGGVAIGTFMPVQTKHSMRVSAPGRLTLQWSQVNTDPNPTRVKKGSYLKATRLGS